MVRKQPQPGSENNPSPEAPALDGLPETGVEESRDPLTDAAQSILSAVGKKSLEKTPESLAAVESFTKFKFAVGGLINEFEENPSFVEDEAAYVVGYLTSQTRDLVNSFPEAIIDPSIAYEEDGVIKIKDLNLVPVLFAAVAEQTGMASNGTLNKLISPMVDYLHGKETRQAEREELVQQLEDAHEQIRTVRAENDTLRGELEEVRSRLTRMETEFAELRAELAKAKAPESDKLESPEKIEPATPQPEEKPRLEVLPSAQELVQQLKGEQPVKTDLPVIPVPADPQPEQQAAEDAARAVLEEAYTPAKQEEQAPIEAPLVEEVAVVPATNEKPTRKATSHWSKIGAGIVASLAALLMVGDGKRETGDEEQPKPQTTVALKDTRNELRTIPAHGELAPEEVRDLLIEPRPANPERTNPYHTAVGNVVTVTGYMENEKAYDDSPEKLKEAQEVWKAYAERGEKAPEIAEAIIKSWNDMDSSERQRMDDWYGAAFNRQALDWSTRLLKDLGRL